jgi:hypothetical protein
MVAGRMGVGPSREELREGENLDGLSEEQLATFRHRAVPEPGGVLREGAELTNDTRASTFRPRSSARGSRPSS